MRTSTIAIAGLVMASTLLQAEARVNSTGAVETFLITDCAECTRDQDSIFCTEGDDSNFVRNRTYSVNIRTKKRMFGSADGSKYCWTGTFGRLLQPEINNADILGSTNVTARLTCNIRNLFYRQCVLPTELTIILMSIASILCVCGTTCTCFYCGCCKCCNNAGDESKWGMCNRFCPWAPCADPPEKENEVASHLVNPLSEDEQKASLFGKNPALKALEEKARLASLSDVKKPAGAASPALGGSNV